MSGRTTLPTMAALAAALLLAPTLLVIFVTTLGWMVYRLRGAGTEGE